MINSHITIPGFLTLCCLAGPGLTALAAQPEFERREFAMPMRCDVAVPADIDADGDLDLVGVCRTRVVAVQLPEGTLHDLYDAEGGAMIHAISLDLDEDGDRDVAIARFQNPHLGDGADPPGENWTIGWLENTGTPGAWPLHVVDREVNGSHGIAAGDLDADGQLDLVSANVSGPHHPKSVTWWPAATGERRFVVPGNAGGRPHYVAVGDLDGDGLQDVALGTGGGWSVHLQEPGGKAWASQTLGDHPGGTNVALADLDADGDLDVIGGTGHGSGVFWFENPEWTRHTLSAELEDVHSLAAGDLDGDGDPDIVLNSNKSHITQIFWNTGAGQFTTQTIDEGHGQQSYGAMIEDIDADGQMDILLGGRGSNNIVWYRGSRP